MPKTHIKVFTQSGALAAQGDGHKARGVSGLDVVNAKPFNQFRRSR